MKLVGIVLVNLFFVHGILGMEQEEQTSSRETRMLNVEVGSTKMYWLQKRGSFSGTVVRELANKKKELQDSKKNTKPQKDT